MSIKSVMPSNYIILCRSLFLLPSIFSSIRVFSNETTLHIRWPKTVASALASVLPMNIQDWFHVGLTGLISFQSEGLSIVFSNTTVQKHQFLSVQLSLWSNSHIHTGDSNGNPLQYLAWKIPWMEEPGRLQSMRSQRVGHNWATSLSLFTFMHWRRKWQPTPVFLPGASQG